MKCPECDGKGEIEHEYTVGGYDGGPWMEYRVRWTPCERCDGTGEIVEDA